MRLCLCNTLLLVSTALAQGYFGTLCQYQGNDVQCEGSAFCAMGEGMDFNEAKNDAFKNIAGQVSSSISIVDSSIYKQTEEISRHGKYESESEEMVRKEVVKSVLENVALKTFEPVTIKDRFYVPAYVCKSDVARPWLDSLDAEVTKYSNLAIKIAEAKDPQKRDELLNAAASVKNNINRAGTILNSIAIGSVSKANQRYSKLNDDFIAAQKKIELAIGKVYDKNYVTYILPLLPPGGWAQLYKGHYGRAALILVSEVALLAAGGISIGNYNDADRKYKDAVQKYNGSNNLNEKNELLQKSKNHKSDRESAENTAFTMFLLAGVVYVYNIVDGYATTPDKPRWHLATTPVPSQNGIGAALALTGNF